MDTLSVRAAAGRGGAPDWRGAGGPILPAGKNTKKSSHTFAVRARWAACPVKAVPTGWPRFVDKTGSSAVRSGAPNGMGKIGYKWQTAVPGLVRAFQGALAGPVDGRRKIPRPAAPSDISRGTRRGASATFRQRAGAHFFWPSSGRSMEHSAGAGGDLGPHRAPHGTVDPMARILRHVFRGNWRARARNKTGGAQLLRRGRKPGRMMEGVAQRMACFQFPKLIVMGTAKAGGVRAPGVQALLRVRNRREVVLVVEERELIRGQGAIFRLVVNDEAGLGDD